MDTKGMGLRERTRRAVQAELTATAIDLFVRQGYDATPVEQIAEAAGLSRRSFHRYFSSKDDVMAAVFAEAGERIVGALAARPDGEAPWIALRRSFDGPVAGMSSQRALAVTRMIRDSPSLHASQLRRLVTWRERLAGVLAPRLPGDLDDGNRQLRASGLAAAALGCLDAAQAAWSDNDGRRPLAELLDAAMSAVAPIGGDTFRNA